MYSLYGFNVLNYNICLVVRTGFEPALGDTFATALSDATTQCQSSYFSNNFSTLIFSAAKKDKDCNCSFVPSYFELIIYKGFNVKPCLL
jgi:hypothetical protein